jgi:hypothetical protein
MDIKVAYGYSALTHLPLLSAVVLKSRPCYFTAESGDSRDYAEMDIKVAYGYSALTHLPLLSAVVLKSVILPQRAELAEITQRWILRLHMDTLR